MDWEEWEKLYLKIVEEMRYSIEKDLEAAEILNRLISGKAITIEELREKLSNKNAAAIFGAGPSLTLDILDFVNSELLDEVVVIVADGASRAFIERGLRMDVVVTDLDGGDDILTMASERCIALAVHAHGDNIERMKILVPLLSGKILGTTQCKPFDRLYNFGGFTDGDRAVFLADAMGFDVIILAGMDFGEEVGEYSKNIDKHNDEWLKAKRKKLRIGKNLLEIYASKSTRRLYNVTSRGEEVKGFIRSSFKEISDMLKQYP